MYIFIIIIVNHHHLTRHWSTIPTIHYSGDGDHVIACLRARAPDFIACAVFTSTLSGFLECSISGRTRFTQNFEYLKRHAYFVFLIFSSYLKYPINVLQPTARMGKGFWYEIVEAQLLAAQRGLSLHSFQKIPSKMFCSLLFVLTILCNKELSVG